MIDNFQIYCYFYGLLESGAARYLSTKMVYIAYM